MKRNIFIYIVLFAIATLALSATSIHTESTVDAHTIIKEMNKSIANVKTLTYNMVYTERLDGEELHLDSTFVKYQRTPHKIFMKMSDGAEVLWSADASNGDATVHPNSFPYVTLQLDPDGSIMRKNQHHGVESAGYDYFGKVLEHSAIKAGRDFDSHFLYLGEIVYRGVRCYNINVFDPGFKYEPYVVSDGETIMTIAKKLWVNEYMLMQYNNLSSYTDLHTGQTIMVPSNYGKLMTLYIDETTMLPRLLKVDDDKGLFEKYVFINVHLNPPMSADEFSKDNKSYHF